MHEIKLAIFDMAGTVVNEDNVVYKTLQKAISDHEIAVDLPYVLEHGAGKEKLTAIKDIIASKDASVGLSRAEEIYVYFKTELNKAYAALEVTSYDRVEMLLQLLKKSGVKVVLNTGYDRETAQLLLHKMQWQVGAQYDLLVTADDVTMGRPHPDMIFEAMNAFGITDPQFVLKAGDSIIDIEEGKNAKCGLTVGVTTGAHSAEQLKSSQPTYVVDALWELQDKLLLS